MIAYINGRKILLSENNIIKTLPFHITLNKNLEGNSVLERELRLNLRNLISLKAPLKEIIYRVQPTLTITVL